MMEPQTDAEIETVKDALDALEDMKGQKYIRSILAFDLLRPFYGHPEAYDIPTGADGNQLPLGEIVYDISSHPNEARGFVFVPQFQMVTTVAEVSANVAENVQGVYPAPANQYAGAGFSADAQHTDNMARLKRVFGLEDEDD